MEPAYRPISIWPDTENVDQILNECHPTTKKNKMFAGKCMELTQKDSYQVFSLICGIQASMGRVWEEGWGKWTDYDRSKLNII
ncbi:hypothetical protein I79_010407 [Cricetulus griseus]|uniref:Uncharacterized protein n=1 Tax=Cricetulus griseus TaxID=10029 RepID=G3HIE6_CRIGR|nr:hypothetical protein I79_010407 [Cricetulus griseus]